MKPLLQMATNMSGRTPLANRELQARDLALFGLLGGVMFASKMAMAWLPNIEPVSLLVMVYTVALGRRALYPIYAYVALEFCVWGIHLWSINYLYIWLILYMAVRCFQSMHSAFSWAILSGTFGLCFGFLCTPVYLLSGGWSFALSWWISGIPWDIIHCVGNFVLALILFPVLHKLLNNLLNRFFAS